MPKFLRRNTSLESNASATSVGSCMSSYSTNPQLESLAESLRHELRSQNLVKDQALRLKTIPKAFSGKSAVTILQNLLQERCQDSAIITREEALSKGNEMMTEFAFFRHASTTLNKDKPLQDSATDFYRFDHNLPSEVRRAKNLYKSHWDKVRLLEQHVECKDRRHMFRMFPHCFVARECVDVMMDLRLVKSRREAVFLMKRLNQKVFCCEHVCQEHDFKDEYLFFEFVPSNERMPEPAPKKSAAPSPNKRKTTKTKKTKSKRRAKDTSSDAAGSVLDKPVVKTEEEIKKTNLRRAEAIKARLASYKQETILMTKREEPQPAQRLSNVAA